MWNIIKTILACRQVYDVYLEEKGKPKPWYYSRRLWGALLALGAGYVTVHYGVQIDQMTIDQISNNLVNLITFIIAAVGAATTLYGLVMHAIGWKDRKKIPSNLPLLKGGNGGI